jgi:solute carrier family 35 protein F5
VDRFVGLFNTLFLLPFIPILHFLGVETFRLPLKKDEWIVCGINMVITLSSDYLYVLSMLKTTPLGEFSPIFKGMRAADEFE